MSARSNYTNYTIFYATELHGLYGWAFAGKGGMDDRMDATMILCGLWGQGNIFVPDGRYINMIISPLGMS